MTRALLVALAALALAGCGVVDEVGAPHPTPTWDAKRYGPQHAPPNVQPSIPAPKLVAPSATVAHQLDSGTVGLMDFTGHVFVRPTTLATSSDGQLTGLTWSRWDADGAQGSGTLQLLTCPSMCAAGQTVSIPAQITLSAAKLCAGRRYYDHAALHIDPSKIPSGDEGQPAAYDRAPC